LKKILIIRLSAIGDVLLATPLIEQTRNAFPDAEIHFLTKPDHAPLLAENPFLNRVMTTDAFSENGDESEYDAIIDLQNNRRSRALRKGKSARIVQYEKQNWKKFLLVRFKWNLYRESVPVPLRYLSAAEPLGVRDGGSVMQFFLSDAEKETAKNFRESLPVIAIGFGAKHFTKRFPPEKFASVINQLVDDERAVCWLLGGNDDAPLAETIMHAVTKKHCVKNFSGILSLRETAMRLSVCEVMLSNDTGLMHLAACFQKPIVAMFGSSVTEFGFAPFRTPNVIIENKTLDCRPCSHIGKSTCPKEHFRCMNDLRDDEIIGAVKKFLIKT
jgi:ADP-heptose:LPS heptosyltransferase